MSHHNANCTGCAHFDDLVCQLGKRWHEPVPVDAFCHTPTLYQHPDGNALIYVDHESGNLVVSNEQTGVAIYVPIAARGLRELAIGLIEQALKSEGV